MSLQKDTENKSSFGAGTAKPKFGGTKSLLSLSSTLGAVLNRSANGAALDGFKRNMVEILKNADPSMKLEVIGLDNQSTGLVYSILVLKGEAAGQTAIYQMIVAASAEPRAPKIEKIGNREFEIPVTPGDMYSAELQAKVTELLAGRLNRTDITEVGTCVLPADLDYENVDAIRLQTHTAICAITDYLRNAAGADEYFNAADYQTAQFRARLVFNGGDTEDILGQPQRTNFHLTLTGAERNSANSNIMQTETQLATASGFMNLRYVGPQQVPAGPQGGTMLSTQMLVPVVNINSTVVKQDVLTPELHLLGLALTTILGRNNAWEHAFRPTRGVSELTAMMTNLNGLSTDLGVKIDTKDPNVPFDLKHFLNTFVFPMPVYRMDIEECGSTTWLNEMIREACRGNAEAYNMVYDTAQRLTNGKFGTRFPVGTAIGRMEADRILLGYYRDRDGVKRDLRDIDKLALDNMNPEDPTIGIEYERTLNEQYAPLPQRISERVSILERQLQGQLTITGYATGVILNPDFMLALFQGVEEAGMQIRLDSAFDAQQVYDRNYGALLQFGLNTQSLQFQNNANFGGQYNYNPFGRFSR